MKVERQNVAHFLNYNRAYHTQASNLIQNICQTDHKIGGYIHARFDPAPRAGWNVNNAASQLVTNEYAGKVGGHSPVPLAGLGEYERLLLSCVEWGEYPTYVLIGDMGSGKTTTLKALEEALRTPGTRGCHLCKKCQPVILFLNFNRGFSRTNAELLVETFKRRLYDLFHKALRRVIRDNDLMGALVDDLDSDAWEGFDEFALQVEADLGWSQRSSLERTNALFEYISGGEDYVSRLERMVQVLGFVKQTMRPHNACMAVIYDNIDSLLPEAQYDILLEILRLQEFAQVKAVVAMRRGTFVKLNNQAAYSFGVVNHAGPSVGDVLKARLEYYETRWEELPEVAALPASAATALLSRLRYFKHQLAVHGGAGEALSYIAGSSVRLALFASERVFSNGTIAFDRDPPHPDDLTRAILVGRNELPEIDGSDKLVASLLTDSSTGRFSMIHIRILQLLTVFNDASGKRNLLNLIAQLRAIGGWSSTEVRSSLNYLLGIRRPLIWVDGKGSYKTTAEMVGADDVIYLTDSGRLYLKRLVKDLVYFQECAVATDWPAGTVPRWVDYAHFSERFQLLRMALDAMLKVDQVEVERYGKWARREKGEFAVRVELITAAIARSVGQSFINIVASGDAWKAPPVVDEVGAWSSFLVLALNADERLSGVRYNSLAQLCVDYETALVGWLVKPNRQTITTR